MNTNQILECSDKNSFCNVRDSCFCHKQDFFVVWLSLCGSGLIYQENQFREKHSFVQKSKITVDTTKYTQTQSPVHCNSVNNRLYFYYLFIAYRFPKKWSLFVWPILEDDIIRLFCCIKVGHNNIFSDKLTQPKFLRLCLSLFNRPSVAVAVLSTPLSFIN